MPSLADLTNTVNGDRNAARVRPLMIDSSRATFIRPISLSSYNTNWSISHIPGPPSPSLTSFVLSSFLSTTPTTTITTIVLTEDRYYPFWLLIIVAIIGSIISVLTVLGNILVILAFFLDRQIRQPTNYFILSLSVSDFLIGLLSMPIFTIYIYAREWPLNAIMCDIWLSLDYTVCLTSIYTVLFITIDRFCSVKLPAKYRKWRTRRKINVMIAVTWAVPTLIFFTSTMLYPRLRSISNMQNGVCDAQWNKNQVFNLCLTIGYFWTTLFVMIVLYIFIYDVASNLEQKSRENARKMSSLVSAAGNTMTQIGVGIGVNRSQTKTTSHKRNYVDRKMDSTTGDEYDDEDPRSLLAQSVINTQNSSNSSDQHCLGGFDDDNSNSYESHSDFDCKKFNEKFSCISNKSTEKASQQKNRRIMNVNLGNNSTTAYNITSTRANKNQRYPQNREQINQKYGSNMKFFATSMAQSFYRNPICLSSLSSTSKTKDTNFIPHKKNSQLNNSKQEPKSIMLTPIPSESEFATHRINPPPQPRPESLAIMSEELFSQRIKAHQPPLASLSSIKPSTTTLLNVNDQLSRKFPSTSSFLLDKHCMEDVTYSTTNQFSSTKLDRTTSLEEQTTTLMDIEDNLIELPIEKQQQIPLSIKTIANNGVNSSEKSCRLLNNNNSLNEHIPYIDESDFEDLGYILHRRRVPPIDSNEPIHKETIVYKSPSDMMHKHNTKPFKISSNNKTNNNDIKKEFYEIYGNHDDVHCVLLESPMFDNVELITCACTKSNSSPIHHVPRETLLQMMSQPVSLSPLIENLNDEYTTSSIIFVSEAKMPPLSSLEHSQQQLTTIENTDVDDKASIDVYQCSQINDINENLINNNDKSESEDLEYSLSKYGEICEETSSLLQFHERHSSAFIDDESGTDDYAIKIEQEHSNFPILMHNNHHFMKMMMLNKKRRSFTIDTTSDDRTTTNSFSLNQYSQDFSADKLFQYDSSTSNKQLYNTTMSNQKQSSNDWHSSSSTTVSSSNQDKQISLLSASLSEHFLQTTEKEQNASSDSDALTTTTTTLTNSIGRDTDGNKKKLSNSLSQDALRTFNQLNEITNVDEATIQHLQRNKIDLILNKKKDLFIKSYSLSDTVTMNNNTSGYDDPLSINNRISSKVTFDSTLKQSSVLLSPKTKDQSIMTHIDMKEHFNQMNNTHYQEQRQNNNENKNESMPAMSEGTVTSRSTSARSNFKEFAQNQKEINHRKSKSRNRARKALRTITFILGAFVLCWTPWHIYSAIHSLCDTCKNNWIFLNPMFHFVYFLCYLNSPVNPFCYALANQQFKKTFTRILKLDLRRL